MGGPTIVLPTHSGELQPFTFSGQHVSGTETGVSTPPRSRVAYAAAHVVADPLRGGVDWDATIAYRDYLWSRGLGVAEAMDTAQRGMGLDPGDVAVLIRRSLAAAAEAGGTIAAGMATDALPPGPAPLDAIVRAYRDQLDLVAGSVATPVIMASRQLAQSATGIDDYRRVYDAVLSAVNKQQPVLLHWLGEMFDPQLAGYWGTSDLSTAVDNVIELVTDHAGVVAGVKLSLLDADAEAAFRRRLPVGVACYTGDDFNYPRLIAGDEHGFSHALLGIFDAIADVAGAALTALDADDRIRYDELLAPTVPLSRTLFEVPTFHYKTGIVFLAYLRGHQQHFRMLGGAESARSVVHLAKLVCLADAAGLFADPDDVVRRLRPVLNAAGIW
jgi:hypothetical protein